VRVFEIAGAEYPIPPLASFTMDEAVVFYNACGYPIEDLWLIPADEDLEAQLEKLRNPAVVKTLLHVAYRRGHPDVSDKQIAKTVGQVPLAVALAAFIPDDDEVPAVPLERTIEPNESSKRSSLDAPRSSGSGSGRSSDEPETDPSRTGTSASDHPFTFDPVMSAA